MPELPEVETVRRDLERCVVGRAIVAVPWMDPRLVKSREPEAWVRDRMAGERVTRIGRRGKFLVWGFQSGARLVLHLGMSGRIRTGWDPAAAVPPHTHLIVRLDDGTEVRLTDPRRFGRIVWCEPGVPLGLRLGPEPLSPRFTARRLGEILAGRRAPVKALLLDQRVVAGIGNIYADEALFRARVHPTRAGGDLTPRDVGRLHRSLRAVLREAIQCRGTTFLTFEDTSGRRGEYGTHLRVYGQANRPCLRCATPVAAVRVAGRTSHFCPKCQAVEDEGPREETGDAAL